VLSLDENFAEKKAAKWAKGLRKLLSLVFQNAVMLPTKLLIFLQPNARVSSFDILNFMFTFLSLTVGINQLEFDLEDFNIEEFLPSCPLSLRYTLIALRTIVLSQLASIIVFLTFYCFFASHGVSMSDNFVQKNYDQFGVWGETYTQD
jgi:hypothetical protein